MVPGYSSDIGFIIDIGEITTGRPPTMTMEVWYGFIARSIQVESVLVGIVLLCMLWLQNGPENVLQNRHSPMERGESHGATYHVEMYRGVLLPHAHRPCGSGSDEPDKGPSISDSPEGQ